MSNQESVASKKIEKRNSLSNNAQSSIRKSGRNAGFTGKKLSIFVMVITATLIAMIYAPTLAYGIRTQIDETKLAYKQAGYEGNRKKTAQNLAQKNAMTDVLKNGLGVNKRATNVALQQLQQISETKKATNNIASKVVAVSAFRHFFNLPVKFLYTATGVTEDAFGIISKTVNNIRRTAGAVTGTAAGVSENVGATALTITGSVKNTTKFLGPYVFIFTMVSIMAGSTGVSAPILKQITSMLSGMMSKGIPATKSLLIKVFNMMYNDKSGINASNRITNVTNNKNTATSK
jgi:hypothetical protein